MQETVIDLAKRGARVIMCCRDLTKAEEGNTYQGRFLMVKLTRLKMSVRARWLEITVADFKVLSTLFRRFYIFIKNQPSILFVYQKQKVNIYNILCYKTASKDIRKESGSDLVEITQLDLARYVLIYLDVMTPVFLIRTTYYNIIA